MISFVNIAALFGLAAVAVPILIHLIRFRVKRQEVPSLLLFDSLRKRSRKRRLQDLLLLVFRVLTVIFLVFLLARPFIYSNKLLVSPGNGCQSVLAVVLDNSSYSLATVDGKSFFEAAKERILDRLEQLPSQTRVIIATSSSRTLSPPMTLEDAKKLIERMEALTETGRLQGALNLVWKRIMETPEWANARILLIAPRVTELWRGVENVSSKMPSEMLVVDDLVRKKQSPFLKGVGEDPSHPAHVKLGLGGKTEELTACKIQILNRNGKELRVEKISLPAAASGEIEIPVDTAMLEGVEFRLQNGVENSSAPYWSRLFYRKNNIIEVSKTEVLILHDDEKNSIITARMLYVALKSVFHLRSDAPSVRMTKKLSETEMKSPSKKFVFITPLRNYDENVSNWSKALKPGNVLIVFPPERGLVSLQSPPLDSPALFNRLRKVPNSAALHLENQKAVTQSLVDIFVRGLCESRVRRFRPVEERPGDISILRCLGQSVFTWRESSSGALLGLWGIPFSQGNMSLITNPLFPQLIKNLVLSIQKAPKTVLGQLTGNVVSLENWLDKPRAVAQMVSPDGSIRKYAWDPKSPLEVYLKDAGFYTFKMEDADTVDKRLQAMKTEVRVVNHPRPRFEVPELKVFEKQIAIKDDIAAPEKEMLFRRISRENILEKSKMDSEKFELSHLVAVFLWIFISVESLLAAARTPKRARKERGNLSIGSIPESEKLKPLNER